MRRRLLTVLSAMSLLLCAATVILWVRGRYVADSVLYHYGDVKDAKRVWLQSAEGGVMVSWESSPPWGEPVAAEHFEPAEQRWKYEQSRPPELQGPAVFKDEFDPSAPKSPRDPGDRVTVQRLGGFWAWNIDESWGRGRAKLRGVVAPSWSIALLSMLLPARWLQVRRRDARRRRQKQREICPECGYDLRATHGRCPECGTAPAAKEA